MARVALALIAGAWSLLLVAWLTLHWGILPQAQQWRPQIEQRASAALGIPVQIGNIVVRSGGWIPALEMTDVVLRDREGREALRLPKVAAAVSARSLLTLQLRFEQLLIEGARLDVRRDAGGRLHVAGVPMGGSDGPGGGGGADWFFAQHEFVVRGGTLRWTDEQRAAPPLELSAVDLVVRNGLRRHDLRLDATPPPAWGDRFSLRGRFHQPVLARAGDWRRWSGTLYADLPRADVAELRRHVDLPFELTGGEGAVRAWVELKAGEPGGATADVALQDVTLRLAADVQPLAFERIEGRVTAAKQPNGYAVTAERFGFVTGAGDAWPAGALALTLRRAVDGAPVDGGEFSADRLDLALMAQVAHGVPLGAPVRRLLAELAPRGAVQGLSARWDGALDAPVRYQVKTRAQGLTIAAAAASAPQHAGRPGWRNADLELEATERGGSARVAMQDGALEFPGVFDEPVIPLDTLSAQLAWRIEPVRQPDVPPRIEVRAQGVRFGNADTQGEFSATWRTGTGAGAGRGARLPGTLELAGTLADTRAAAVARYLPHGIPEHTRQYVAQAIRDGQVPQAAFKVRGDLADFPFDKNARLGEFRVTARAEGLAFAYVPGEAGAPPPWPAFERVSGDLVFDRASMELRNVRAQVYGLELSPINASIRDFHHSVLTVDGQARGPAADLVRYANASPVGGWIGDALAQASVGGAAELRLGLVLPLGDMARSTVKGSVTLAGNDVRLRPDVPLLAQARARIAFTEKTFTLAGGAARLLGGDATFEGGSAADGAVRFTAQGTASADGLRRATELGALARVAGAFGGQAPYRVALAVPKGGRPEFNVSSSLQGLSIDLPAPLRKTAVEAMPLRVSGKPLAEAGRDTVAIEIGTWGQAHFERDVSGSAPKVLSGGIGIGEPAPTPAAGVHASVRVPRLDADAWSAVLDRHAPAAGGGGSSGAAPDGAYLPATVALRTEELVTGSRLLTRVVAGLTRDGSRWRANLDAEQLSGYGEWHPGSGAQPGVVYARLSRLSLPEAQAESVVSLLDEAPTSAPSLDIVVDDFELRGKRLGRVEVEAANHADGVWRLNRLSLGVPEARLAATGQWAPKKRMVLDFTLDLADGGDLVERLGLGRALRGGKGRLAGQVSWAGSPLSFHVPSLDGSINLAVENGRFLKAGPGAARLLSVLSLQSLPRRLSLDFRDVFQEGFPFDQASGDITIRRGVAVTNNFRMRGAQAAVLMEGQADLDRETQDLRVIVVPEINAGTASLAYAAINPAIGLTTFLAQMVLRRPLMAAGTREFHVTGGWDEPKVERVQRKLGEPLPDLDPPAAAAAPASAPVRQ